MGNLDGGFLMETKNIFITGGLGFIGSNIAKNLINHGQNVTIATLSKKNMWRIGKEFDSIEIIEYDVTNRNQVFEKLKQAKPNIIIHNAVFGAYHEQDQNKIYNVNLIGTLNMVNAYLETNAELFINTSTVSEYGIKESAFEETDQLKPLGDYAASKAAATLFCESTKELSRRKILTTRISNPYGPFERPKDLIPYLIISQMKGGEAKLNSPYNVRDFIYIKDLVEAYWQIISSYDRIVSSILNVATGTETSIGKLAQMIGEIVLQNAKAKVAWNANEPRVKDRTSHYSASINRITSELGWHPRYTIEQGIKDFYSWIVYMETNNGDWFKNIYRIEGEKDHA